MAGVPEEEVLYSQVGVVDREEEALDSALENFGQKN
jgi:hypothetical protein